MQNPGDRRSSDLTPGSRRARRPGCRRVPKIGAVIDPLTEELLTPTQATAFFPRGREGRKVHVSAIYRYMTRGCDGIVLESIRTPRLATSREAIGRFLSLLNQGGQPSATPSHARPAPGEDAERTRRELKRIGL